MTENEKQLLKKELKSLALAAKVLGDIYAICLTVGLKKEYTLNELIHLEALTSRFARLSDLLIRKIFRLIDRLDYEPQDTVRDSINRAEKIGVIQSALLFSEIRQTRNAIAHEYLLEDLSLLYKEVFTNTPTLLETADRAIEYCKRYT